MEVLLVPQLLIIAISTFIILEFIKKIPAVKNWKYKSVFLGLLSVFIGACLGGFSMSNMPDFVKESIVLTLCFGGIGGYFSTLLYNLTLKPLKEKVKLSEMKIEEIKDSLIPPPEEQSSSEKQSFGPDSK